MDELAQLIDFLAAPLVRVAVFIGEANAALAHGMATGATNEEMAVVRLDLTVATAAWATRRVAVGAITWGQAVDVHAVIEDARQWCTRHPADLAAYDQEFAAFRDRRGEG